MELVPVSTGGRRRNGDGHGDGSRSPGLVPMYAEEAVADLTHRQRELLARSAGTSTGASLSTATTQLGFLRAVAPEQRAMLPPPRPLPPATPQQTTKRRTMPPPSPSCS